MLNRPFLELSRVFLLRDLFHLLPPKSNVNCTSPLEDYLSGDPQNIKAGLVTSAGHIPKKHVGGVTAVIMRLFEPYKDQCRTITYDNDKEFAEHESPTTRLQAAVYFAPYHSGGADGTRTVIGYCDSTSRRSWG